MTLVGPLYKATVRMAKKSALPRDAAQIDLHFMMASGMTSSDADNLRDDIMAFFNTSVPGPAASVNSLLSKSFSTATDGVSIDIYSVPLTRGPLGPPVFTRSGTLTAVGSSSYPAEVALCMSFQSDVAGISEFGPGGTRPRASRRNRIFLGPLSQTNGQIDPVTFEEFVDPFSANLVTLSAKAQLGVAAAADGLTWAVFTPKLWEAYNVVQVSMDLEFDTQRRRGLDATIRTIQSVP